MIFDKRFGEEKEQAYQADRAYAAQSAQRWLVLVGGSLYCAGSYFMPPDKMVKLPTSLARTQPFYLHLRWFCTGSRSFASYKIVPNLFLYYLDWHFQCTSPSAL